MVEAPDRGPWPLRIVRVQGDEAVTSEGEVLWIRYEKVSALAEQCCQEEAPVIIRTWELKDRIELVWIKRVTHHYTPPFYQRTLADEQPF